MKKIKKNDFVKKSPKKGTIGSKKRKKNEKKMKKNEKNEKKAFFLRFLHKNYSKTTQKLLCFLNFKIMTC